MQFSMIFEAQMAATSIENEHEVIRGCVEQAVVVRENPVQPEINRLFRAR